LYGFIEIVVCEIDPKMDRILQRCGLLIAVSRLVAMTAMLATDFET